MEYTTVGSGSYGIVFSPPINNSSLEMSNNKDDLVGKVLLTDDEIEIAQEWEASEYLQEIDPQHKYFVYPIKKVHLEAQDLIKHAKKPLKSINPSMKVTQFIMVNGGPSMRSIARQKCLSFDNIIDCILQSAQCIKVLQNNNFIHQDIHLGNIVNKDGKHRLIDFGLMITSSQYYTPFNALLNEEYAISPPEYRLLQTDKQNNSNINFEQELLAKYIGIQTEGLNDVFKNRYFIMSYNYLVRSLKNNDPFSYLKKIKSYNKADIYSLGVCLIEMLSYLDDKSVPSEFVPQLSSLIVRMLMPHPENRIDIDVLIFKLTTISNVLKIKNG
jgi:serine/threonine protein kinase